MIDTEILVQVLDDEIADWISDHGKTFILIQYAI